MYFIVTLGVGVGAVGQPKLGLNWVYTGCTLGVQHTAGLRGR